MSTVGQLLTLSTVSETTDNCETKKAGQRRMNEPAPRKPDDTMAEQKQNEINQKQQTPIILAIDAGSSSIRCTAYEYHEFQSQNYYARDGSLDEKSDSSSSSPIIGSLENASHSIQMTSVIPNSGFIRINEVLTAVDECIDEVLRLLRLAIADQSYEVIAIGFSTFVMNLIGVDEYGEPVGDTATLSYACNRGEVVRECQDLRE